MAGGREPLKLVLHKGKKHLTKEEIAKREKEEIQAPADNVKPPSYLSRDLKREFKKIADELMRIGIISNLDGDALARYLQSRKMYLQITDKLLIIPPVLEKEVFDEKIGEMVIDMQTNDVYTDLLKNQNKLFAQCRTAATDLGLTISSRCKLVIPEGKQDKDKPADPRESKFGSV